MVTIKVSGPWAQAPYKHKPPPLLWQFCKASSKSSRCFVGASVSECACESWFFLKNHLPFCFYCCQLELLLSFGQEATSIKRELSSPVQWYHCHGDYCDPWGAIAKSSKVSWWTLHISVCTFRTSMVVVTRRLHAFSQSLESPFPAWTVKSDTNCPGVTVCML